LFLGVADICGSAKQRHSLSLWNRNQTAGKGSLNERARGRLKGLEIEDLLKNKANQAPEKV
jgi:hypothetical protein